MDWNGMFAVHYVLKKKFAKVLAHSAAIHSSLESLNYYVLFKEPYSLLSDRIDNSSNARIPDLFEALMVHGSKLSTDPRDQIYALAGLTAARDNPHFVIDYSLSVRQVFINIADYVLRSSQHLDFICANTRETGRLYLPARSSN
jgi:hypothetical protein